MKNKEIMKHLDTMTNEIFIDGNLELEENLDTEGTNLKVKGNIIGKNGLRWNISAGDISAWYISAGNISARDISAGDISAGDISYYAVCFAHQNIKCKSIEGRRENSRHFCLDGKVVVNGKEERKK